MILPFLKSLYFHKTVFYIFGALATLFLCSYWFHVLYPVVWIMILLLCFVLLLDSVILYQTKEGIMAKRLLPQKFSNSDFNAVPIRIQNAYAFTTYIEIIDEIPVQFQKRDFLKKGSIVSKSTLDFEYELRPVTRGQYHFGSLHVYVMSRIRLVKRRYRFDTNAMVKVYPSFQQMKKYDFLAIDRRISLAGLKKVRRIGNTSEFEQIKTYVTGDDIRTVNWKATAKQGHLMVNQFQDEKSQPIYSLIDTSRVMKMPFEGLSLVDYAINSTLAFSNIALKKKDKVGMVSFSNTIEQSVPAKQHKNQLHLISETLYSIDSHFLDSDYSLLYAQVKRKINHRSLLLLYTNFEHISALHRQLPYLQALAKKHLLVVIFFENTTLTELVRQEANTVEAIYEQTIATQFMYDKKVMATTLQKYGIQTILTTPQNLTINTINKYLEIKARGSL